jgi:methionyl-tRNA formyltransferase
MVLKRYILLTDKRWHDDLFDSLSEDETVQWYRITDKIELNVTFLASFNPDKIFIPHWSEIISKEIYSKYDCIVFHMTDLPYGQGGSPLQNLIVRKHKDTKLTAIKIDNGIDTGPIYLKNSLSLNGTALDVFERSSVLIKKMILKILSDNIIPQQQQGVGTIFRRRKREDSDISKLGDIEDVYDYIRMLDCEGYPPAFVQVGYLRIEFSAAELVNNEITAVVKIKNKEK